MKEILHLTRGRGKTKVELSLYYLGEDIIICIYNVNGHSGAIGIGEYSAEEGRASVSVITRRGHKDDAIAQRAAYLVSKHTRKPCCVIAGVHIDSITVSEIKKVLKNTEAVLQDLLIHLRT